MNERNNKNMRHTSTCNGNNSKCKC